MQTCIWPSGCHCHSLSLASVKSRLVLPFWYRLTRAGSPGQRAVKRMCVCVRACVCVCMFKGRLEWAKGTMYYTGCTLASPGEYSYTIQRRYDLMSYCFDHMTCILLALSIYHSHAVFSLSFSPNLYTSVKNNFTLYRSISHSQVCS